MHLPSGRSVKPQEATIALTIGNVKGHLQR